MLWFGLVPLGWFLALKLMIWINQYPINWESKEDVGLQIFLILTGLFGTIALIVGALVLAIHLQE